MKLAAGVAPVTAAALPGQDSGQKILARCPPFAFVDGTASRELDRIRAGCCINNAQAAEQQQYADGKKAQGDQWGSESKAKRVHCRSPFQKKSLTEASVARRLAAGTPLPPRIRLPTGQTHLFGRSIRLSSSATSSQLPAGGDRQSSSCRTAHLPPVPRSAPQGP